MLFEKTDVYDIILNIVGDNRIAVYYNNSVNLVGKNKNSNIWSITVPPNEKKSIESEITLMGHSEGKIKRYFKVN